MIRYVKRYRQIASNPMATHKSLWEEKLCLQFEKTPGVWVDVPVIHQDELDDNYTEERIT